VPMVLVTHDIAEVRQLAGWLVVYSAGRVTAAGIAETLLTEPLIPPVAEALDDR
jgi:ABC-type molybdate transport system ATPase subunit